MNYIGLGKRIREYRTRINMTQEALAEAVGLSAVYISQIETGNRKPSLETVFNISRTLNVGMDALFQDSVSDSETAKIDELVTLLKGRPEEVVAFVTATVREMLKHLKDNSLLKSK